MKTKSIKSPGSLVKRGSNYYCFWRVKGKAICKVLRDENGAAISSEPEAQKAKAKLMEVIARQKESDSLQSIAHAIGDKQAEIKALMDAQNPPMTISQSWTAFVRSPERHDCAKSTLYQYEICWTKFVEWMVANHADKTLLREVTLPVASEYLQSLNHGKLANKTYNHHLATLRYVTKTLTKEARLTENVWATFTAKRDDGFSRRELTVDEIKDVVSAAKGEMKLLFGIGLYTGLRLGDCCTLKWGEVDLHRNQIRRVMNKVARRCPAPVVIPIHSVLAQMLATIPAEHRKGYVLPWHANTYTGENGNSRPQITQAIQKHFESCGIQTKVKREIGRRAIVEVGFHSLRHTFVSMCREANAPLAVVENIVGHHSVSLTRHYTHISEAASKSAVDLLPAIDLN